MASYGRRLARAVATIGVLLGLAAAGLYGWAQFGERWISTPLRASPQAAEAAAAALVDKQPDTLRLPADVIKRMGVRTCTAEPGTEPTPLELSGTLILDNNRFSHVHARFPGEIVEVGKCEETGRPLDFGDAVRKGQLLVVLWSQDLGEKKSELADAASQLRLDQESLDRLTKALAEGAVSEQSLRESQRRVEADRIADARALRTLQAWRVPKEEIDAVYAEAEQSRLRKDRARQQQVQQWARLEIHAPLDGVVLERNAVQGDLADTSVDLFMIADLTRLRVIAHAYEEDLPTLDNLAEDQRRWSIRVGADPKHEFQSGRFDRIGRIIDPNQHTALVMGWVDNSRGRLRVGQFITARIDVSQRAPEVAIPAAAMIEQGSRQIVFVRPDPHDERFVLRRVAVSRRTAERVFVRTEVSGAQRGEGIRPLKPGEQVVSSGVVQLASTLTMLQAEAGK
jgi:membrane fusion protein, heavy metal efflux system